MSEELKVKMPMQDKLDAWADFAIAALEGGNTHYAATTMADYLVEEYEKRFEAWS